MNHDEIKRRAIFEPGHGVGYTKPPEQSRFQKGQSGNPKGRPKKTSADLSLTDQPTLSAILNAADKTVAVRESGELTEMSMREAVIRATFASAAKGNSRAQDTVIRLLEKSDHAKARELRGRNERWRDYKQNASDQIAEAQKRGLSIPDFLPHPDDIIIDHETGPRFLGPFDREGQAELDKTLRYRDILIMQDALDYRSTVRLDGELLTEPGSAGLLAAILENYIPERLKLSTTEWVFYAMKYESIPKRDLLKLLFNAWHKLGIPRPRGYVSQSLTHTQNCLAMLKNLAHEIQDGTLDPESMTLEELAELIEVQTERYNAGGIT